MGHQFRGFLVLISSTARAISSPSRRGTKSPKISFSRSNTPYLPCLTPSSTRSSCKALHSPSSWAFLPAPPRGGSWRKEAPPDRSLTFPGLPTSQLLRDQHGRTGLSWCEPTTTSPLLSCSPFGSKHPVGACCVFHLPHRGPRTWPCVSLRAGFTGTSSGRPIRISRRGGCKRICSSGAVLGCRAGPPLHSKGAPVISPEQGGWLAPRERAHHSRAALALALVGTKSPTDSGAALAPTLPRHSSLCVQVLPGRGGAEVAACPPWLRWSGLICCQGGWYHNCPSCSVGPRVTSPPEPALSVTALPPSLTATVFLELWKRKRATVVTSWDLYEWDEEEVRTFQLPTSLFRAGVSCTYRKDTSQGPPCPA